MVNDRTKVFYEDSADAYARQTLPVRLDVLWNTFAKLLRPGDQVLDLGCGAGRDLKELSQRGFRVLGIEYSATLADIARNYSGQEVRIADFQDCDLGGSQFDGIWAVASLLHIPRDNIPDVLVSLRRALRPEGILLTSMKKGNGAEIAKDGRHFELYQPEQWEGILRTAGFNVIEAAETIEQRYSGTDAIDITWFVMIGRKSVRGEESA